MTLALLQRAAEALKDAGVSISAEFWMGCYENGWSEDECDRKVSDHHLITRIDAVLAEIRAEIARRENAKRPPATPMKGDGRRG